MSPTSLNLEDMAAGYSEYTIARVTPLPVWPCIADDVSARSFVEALVLYEQRHYSKTESLTVPIRVENAAYAWSRREGDTRSSGVVFVDRLIYNPRTCVVDFSVRQHVALDGVSRGTNRRKRK